MHAVTSLEDPRHLSHGSIILPLLLLLLLHLLLLLSPSTCFVSAAQPAPAPETDVPTTAKPSTAKPTAATPTTSRPATGKPTTPVPTTPEEETPWPTEYPDGTGAPATAKPTTATPVVAPSFSGPPDPPPTTATGMPTTSRPVATPAPTPPDETAWPTEGEPATARPTAAATGRVPDWRFYPARIEGGTWCVYGNIADDAFLAIFPRHDERLYPTLCACCREHTCHEDLGAECNDGPTPATEPTTKMPLAPLSSPAASPKPTGIPTAAPAPPDETAWPTASPEEVPTTAKPSTGSPTGTPTLTALPPATTATTAATTASGITSTSATLGPQWYFYPENFGGNIFCMYGSKSKVTALADMTLEEQKSHLSLTMCECCFKHDCAMGTSNECSFFYPQVFDGKNYCQYGPKKNIAAVANMTPADEKSHLSLTVCECCDKHGCALDMSAECGTNTASTTTTTTAATATTTTTTTTTTTVSTAPAMTTTTTAATIATSSPSSQPTELPTTSSPSSQPTELSTTSSPSSQPTELPTTSSPSIKPTNSPTITLVAGHNYYYPVRSEGGDVVICVPTHPDRAYPGNVDFSWNICECCARHGCTTNVVYDCTDEKDPLAPVLPPVETTTTTAATTTETTTTPETTTEATTIATTTTTPDVTTTTPTTIEHYYYPIRGNGFVFCITQKPYPDNTELYSGVCECCEQQGCTVNMDHCNLPANSVLEMSTYDSIEETTTSDMSKVASSTAFWFPDIHADGNRCIYGEDYDSWMATKPFRASQLFATEEECCEEHKCDPDAVTQGRPSEVVTFIDENFDGDQQPLPWIHGGTATHVADWYQTANKSVSGKYSLSSGDLNNNGGKSSDVTLKLDSWFGGYLDFVYYADIGEPFDYFVFKIDGEVKLEEYSPSHEWRKYSVIVPAGLHEISFHVTSLNVKLKMRRGANVALYGSGFAYMDDLQFKPLI